VTIDLRLGYDFLMSVLTRKPFIAIYHEIDYRSVSSYFQNTRRELGDRFVLYPNQVVLTTTLEYLSGAQATFARDTPFTS
jgi:dCTP deaminase